MKDNKVYKNKNKPSLLQEPCSSHQEHPLLMQSHQQYRERLHRSTSFRQRPVLTSAAHQGLVNGPIDGSIEDDEQEYYYTTRRIRYMVHNGCKQNPACNKFYRKVYDKMESSSEQCRVGTMLIFGILMLIMLLHSNEAFLAAREKKGANYHRDIPVMGLDRLKEEQSLRHAHHSSSTTTTGDGHSSNYEEDETIMEELTQYEKPSSGKHMLDTLADLGMLDTKHTSDTINSVLSVVKEADKALDAAKSNNGGRSNSTDNTTSKSSTKQTLTKSDDDHTDEKKADLLPMDAVPMRESKATIAYAVTLMECNDEADMDGAAVLARSIMMNSVVNPKSPSKYGYKLYAFVHTDALSLRDSAARSTSLVASSSSTTTPLVQGDSSEVRTSQFNATSPCLRKLEKLGYEIILKNTPVHPHEIQSPGYFKDNFERSARDYIKINAYALTNHPIVVVMDFTTMLLHPLDELFDSMLYKAGTQSAQNAKKKILFHETGNNTLPDIIDAYYTRDYTTIEPDKVDLAGIQQGLLIVRPSQDVYHELLDIVKSGNFTRAKGWGNAGTSKFLGSMSTKGLLSHYYRVIKSSNNSVELNRCFYNSMSDTPRTKGIDGTMVCRDGRTQCQDCRTANIDRIRTANLSICRKPWKCFYHDAGIAKTFHLCRQFERTWFQIRQNIEDTWAATKDGYTISDRSGTFAPYEFLGNCLSKGEDGYIPMNYPE